MPSNFRLGRLICGCLRFSQCDDTSVYRFSLRFRNKQQEEAFVSRKQPALIDRSLLLYVLGLFVATFSLVFSFLGNSLSGTSVSQTTIRIQQICLGATLFALLLEIGSLSCKRLMGIISPAALEVMISVALTLHMYAAVLSTPIRVCKMQGCMLEQEMPELLPDSDSGILLVIDGVVTATHLFLPMRWCILLPLEFAAIFLYAASSFIIGSEERTINVIFNLLFLTCLVFATSLGKRSTELDERAAFCDIIEQKTRACMAEYKLEQAGSIPSTQMQRDTVSEHQTASIPESTPATACSAPIFDPLFQGGINMSEQLARVAEMGDAEHWRIDQSEINILPGDAIGAGGFGVVLRACFCGMLVAVKRPKHSLEGTDSPKVSDLCNELRVLRHLRHPNIVITHGAVVLPEQQQIMLILEFIDGVVLQDFIKRGGSEVSILHKYQIMLGVCRALLYMHTRSPHIVHGDLKGRNIMVEIFGSTAQPRLLDFGLSRVVTRSARRLGGTLAWLAPEVLKGNAPVRCSADIYSFGRLIAFVATGIPPRAHLPLSKLQRAMARETPQRLNWPEQCPFPRTLMPLVDSCLRTREERRPRIHEIHEGLIGLARELDLSGAPAQVLQNLEAMAAHSAANQSDVRLRDQSTLSPTSGSRSQRDSSSRNRLAPLPENQPLSEDAADVSRGSNAVPQQGKARRRRFPKLPATSSEAMSTTLEFAVSRWNVDLPEGTCCVRHACFGIVRDICSQVNDQHCHQQMETNRSQCRNCGVLDVESSGSCEICGADQDSGEFSRSSNTA